MDDIFILLAGTAGVLGAVVTHIVWIAEAARSLRGRDAVVRIISVAYLAAPLLALWAFLWSMHLQPEQGTAPDSWGDMRFVGFPMVAFVMMTGIAQIGVCRMLYRRGKEEKGEPGATDNPDDAQRLREDH